MNSYYYGKSGKGDYTPDDLPKNRWQLFLEMLRTRMSGLCRMNLMYFVAWLPAMIDCAVCRQPDYDAGGHGAGGRDGHGAGYD